MAEQHCIYPDRESVLVAYLYDDVDAVQRVAFETHVATCEPCRTELVDLRAVRSRLAEWAAPESASRSHQSPVSSRQSRWWHDVPVWAQVAGRTRYAVGEPAWGVDGFRDYYLLRTEGGTASVTVCDDQAGADATNRAAASWLGENLPDAAGEPPKILGGDVVLSF